ncbi:hypothetical protein PL8927_760272 [Planktothrix serta PCC 8927]|uniref:Uncharacterized protein n=1 Tax=Planktothrix serta PCC 8927 TaxID=671068 RepID=A0A7Z9E234_9CYAN|nr:hypothetical protein [Planktothrix serta]VXD23085.1 hypothetical protein PL8927_760272 [Planktothrix serta PCC 8927]
MNTCPCCSSPMLRHARQHQVYWFCRSCWEEMPLLEVQNSPLTVLSRKQTAINSQPSVTFSFLR